MQRVECDGLVSYHFSGLSSSGLSHAVFTRLGGVSQGAFATLNVGHSVGDDAEAVAENHARLYRCAGVQAAQVATARQVHGNRVSHITSDLAGGVVEATDGLVTATPGIGLMLRFADCQPILVYDPANHALGIAHAGWRGVAQGIARRVVEAMRQVFGSQPSALLVGLGPAIGPCCYLVGDEVAAAIGYSVGRWRQALRRDGQAWRLDLSEANAQQLASLGVTHIERSGLCSSCRRDEFFSHRAEGSRTGRFAVLACLGPAPSLHSNGSNAQHQQTPAPRRLEGDAGLGSLLPAGFPSFGEARLAGAPDTGQPEGTGRADGQPFEDCA